MLIFLSSDVFKHDDQIANSVAPDQTAPKEQSDLGCHCFLRHKSVPTFWGVRVFICYIQHT